MSGEKKAYLDNTPRPKRPLVLDQHPSQRRSNLSPQKRLSLCLVHAKLRARPQRDVHLVGIFVHQSLQHDRPGIRVLDVESQYVLESQDVFLGSTAEFGVLEEDDVRVLGERHDFAFDVIGLRLVAGREYVVGDQEAGFDVDGLVVGSFGGLFGRSVLSFIRSDWCFSPVKPTTNFVLSTSTAVSCTNCTFELALLAVSIPRSFITSLIPMYAQLTAFFVSVQPYCFSAPALYHLL